MMSPVTRMLLAAVLFFCISITSYSQPESPEPKPYKVLTSGKQVTIKSEKSIKSIMVWTSSGNRIIEQKAVNATSFTFNAGNKEKIFFVMVRLQNGTLYTEKIGVQ